MTTHALFNEKGAFLQAPNRADNFKKNFIFFLTNQARKV